MKQSSNKKSREATAFLYERLSRDDNLEGESYSIGNQKKLLTKVAKEKGYTNLVHFLDDGISGVTMNRPGFVEMMQQLEQGKASAVFVKDLSRLGRNYIEVGRLTEEFFPDHDIRLVAVSDNIDTAEGENELAPIRNLFNEWYARDISKKRRISNKIKGNSGEPMGLPPYGYIKDPNNPKHWVIDEEAAQVVRRIFDMTLEGFGTEQIATQFEKEGILTPQAYWIQKGIGRPGKTKTRPATKWNGSTITHLLYQQEYCGDVLNFKTYSKSYKNKKRIHNDPENWVVFQDVHEPIIERAVFEQVQQKRGKILSVFIYKSIDLKDMPRILVQTANMTTVVMLIIGASSVLSFVLSFTGLPAAISKMVLGISDNKYVLLLILNIFLLIVGTFMDMAPALLIFTPIFLPIVRAFGMSDVQFGVMMVMNLAVGTITPPVGNVLFVGCSLAKQRLENVMKSLVPFFVAIFISLMLVTYIPALSEWLPTTLGLM